MIISTFVPFHFILVSFLLLGCSAVNTPGGKTYHSKVVPCWKHWYYLRFNQLNLFPYFNAVWVTCYKVHQRYTTPCKRCASSQRLHWAMGVSPIWANRWSTTRVTVFHVSRFVSECIGLPEQNDYYLKTSIWFEFIFQNLSPLWFFGL